MRVKLIGIAVIGIGLAILCTKSIASDSTNFVGFSFVGTSPEKSTSNLIYLVVNGRITCLDGNTGQVVWAATAPGLGAEESPGAGPVLAGAELVYMADGGFSTAYSLDRNTGRLSWSLDNRSPTLAADEENVFLSLQGGLGVVVVDSKSGKIRWSHRPVKVGGTVKRLVLSHGRLYTDSPYVWKIADGTIVKNLKFTPKSLVANNQNVFVVDRKMVLRALDAKTGSVLWKVANSAPSQATKVDSDIAVSDSFVALTLYEGAKNIATRAVLDVLDADSGKLLWKFPLDSSSGLDGSMVNVDETRVYILDTGANSKVTAYDAKSGKSLWSHTDSSVKFIGPAASSKGLLLVYGFDQESRIDVLYALDNSTGTVRWKFESKKAK